VFLPVPMARPLVRGLPPVAFAGPVRADRPAGSQDGRPARLRWLVRLPCSLAAGRGGALSSFPGGLRWAGFGVDRQVRVGGHFRAARLVNAYSESPIWYACMASLVAPTAPRRRAFCFGSNASKTSSRPNSRPRRMVRQGKSLALALTCRRTWCAACQGSMGRRFSCMTARWRLPRRTAGAAPEPEPEAPLLLLLLRLPLSLRLRLPRLHLSPSVPTAPSLLSLFSPSFIVVLFSFLLRGSLLRGQPRRRRRRCLVVLAAVVAAPGGCVVVVVDCTSGGCRGNSVRTV
jgi:hypothetical protein